MKNKMNPIGEAMGRGKVDVSGQLDADTKKKLKAGAKVVEELATGVYNEVKLAKEQKQGLNNDVSSSPRPTGPGGR